MLVITELYRYILLLYLCHRLDLCRTNSFPTSDSLYRGRGDRVPLELSRAATAAPVGMDPNRGTTAVWDSAFCDLEANIFPPQPVHVGNGPLHPTLRPGATTGTGYGEQGYCFIQRNGGSMGRERSFKQIALEYPEKYIRSLGQAQLPAPLPCPASFDFGAPVIRVQASINMGVKL